MALSCCMGRPARHNTVRRLVATPGCCEPVNEQEAAAALVIGARLGWGGQPEVLVPHLNERRLPISREPEMDAGQAGICGVAGSFVLVHRGLDGIGNELGHDQFNGVGQIAKGFLLRRPINASAVGPRPLRNTLGSPRTLRASGLALAVRAGQCAGQQPTPPLADSRDVAVIQMRRDGDARQTLRLLRCR